MIKHGDCLEILRSMEANSIDAMITDPPAGISFMAKSWDGDKGGRDSWIAWMAEVMVEALRVCKPGAYCLTWALPRTSHWTATALEDAGWEVRDRVSHIFGSGFPKNHDISKALDKMAGAEREVVGRAIPQGGMAATFGGSVYKDSALNITAPSTPSAKQWEGWGTALKPAVEDWWLCRKPLEGTVANNVLAWGVGGINIDGSRIGHEEECKLMAKQNNGLHNPLLQQGGRHKPTLELKPSGRWPAHLILTHAPGCERVGDKKIKGYQINRWDDGAKPFGGGAGHPYTTEARPPETIEDWACVDGCPVGDLGEAARYFYTPKPSPAEREAGLALEAQKVNDGRDAPADTPYQRGETKRLNTHPTVKSTRLMEWLINLITPPGGTVLDPFCGSGSTGVAATMLGLPFIGIEREAEYVEIARARMAWAALQHEEANRPPAQMSLFDLL